MRELHAVHDLPGEGVGIEEERHRHRGCAGREVGLLVQFAGDLLGGVDAGLEASAWHELPEPRVEGHRGRSPAHEDAPARDGDGLDADRAHAAVEARLLHRVEAVRALLHVDLHAPVAVAAHAEDLQHGAVEVAGIGGAEGIPAPVDLGELHAGRHETTLDAHEHGRAAELDGAGVHAVRGSVPDNPLSCQRAIRA